MIQCAGCGSNLVYDIARKKMYCKACGNEYEPESVDKDEDSEERKLMELTVFICPQCGGEIYSTDESATGFCSYCGAATMLSSRLKSERRPDYVIPFAVTKDMCKASYATVMKRAIYAPNRLKHRRNVQEFRGIYMPYWLCDVDQKGKTAVRATDSYSSGVDTVSHTYNVRCFADNHYENITMDASSLFPDDLSSKVAPFDSADMKPFSMGYLSGFYADLPDVDYGVYRDKIAQVTGDMAYDVMMSKIKHHLCTYDAIGEPEEPLSETMDIKITGAKTGLFPVWLLSYKNGKRIAYAAVNGSTGKVAADIPLDIGKFLLGCLIGVAPLYFLLNLFLTVRPGVLLAFVSAIGALVTMIYCDEMEKIADVETHENDVGFFARHTLNAKKSGGRKKKLQTKKLPTKKPQKDTKRKIKNKITSFVKFSCFLEVIQLIVCIIVLFCLKFDINPFLFNWDIMGKASYVVACISCLVAIYGAVKGIANVRRVKRKSGVMGLFIAFATILSVAVVLIKPVMDKYYYGCVLLVCAATILTLIDLVISHNRMSTRPLPQFEYKGGDHRA